MKVKATYIILLSAITILLNIPNQSLYLTDAQQQEPNIISREKIELPISNLSVGYTDSGNIFVMGTVINNSTYNVEDVIVDVSLFDKENELVNVDNRFITPPSSILEMGSEQEFKFFVIAEDSYRYNVSSFGSKTQ